VLDSSVITARYAAEEHSEWAVQKMSEYDYFHVLDLNYYEVANALRHKISGALTSKDAHAAWLEASKLMNMFAFHSYSEVVNDLFTVALDLNITVYDAAFLSLAEKLSINFLTLDEKLAKKLKGTRYYGLLECPNK
jgi:predicted nucleic acid-binding protein